MKVSGLVKKCCLLMYVYLWAPCRNLLRAVVGKSHTVVINYHRVSDDYRDAVTVGKEQFQRQVQILKNYCNVLDLQALLSSYGQKNYRHNIVVTFDDGYADNYEAAIYLQSQGVPATFFLSTGIVGTKNPFPQDTKRLGKTVMSLDWEQVREMAEWGFSFGGHTVSHANLGKLSTPEALAEVAGSIEDLRRELRRTDYPAWFAYPYGKREDIRKDVLIEMEKTGIACCCSAYGGTNPPGYDRMNILRQGVNHQFSDLAFRALLQGWRVR